MNALKSGIDARSSIIPGENADALAALTEQFYHDCQPQSVIEGTLVQSRLQRRINDTSRLQREAIKELQRIQAERPQPQPSTPDPQPTETESPQPPIGLVTQTHLPAPAPETAAQPFSPQNRVSGIQVSGAFTP